VFEWWLGKNTKQQFSLKREEINVAGINNRLIGMREKAFYVE
jgi:hypothetical protein